MSQTSAKTLVSFSEFNMAKRCYCCCKLNKQLLWGQLLLNSQLFLKEMRHPKISLIRSRPADFSGYSCHHKLQELPNLTLSLLDWPENHPFVVLLYIYYQIILFVKGCLQQGKVNRLDLFAHLSSITISLLDWTKQHLCYFHFVQCQRASIATYIYVLQHKTRKLHWLNILYFFRLSLHLVLILEIIL